MKLEITRTGDLNILPETTTEDDFLYLRFYKNEGRLFIWTNRPGESEESRDGVWYKPKLK